MKTFLTISLLTAALIAMTHMYSNERGKNEVLTGAVTQAVMEVDHE